MRDTVATFLHIILLRHKEIMSKISKVIKEAFNETFGGSTPTITESKGAYNAMRYIANKMKRTKGNTIFCSFGLSDGVDWDIIYEENGGIIVFPTEVNSAKMSDNGFINWCKQELTTLLSKIIATKKVDPTANKDVFVGWTIGHYFNGSYNAKNGKNYGEDSISLELIGVTSDSIIKVAEKLCNVFQQETVLVKDYSTNRILFVNEN